MLVFEFVQRNDVNSFLYERVSYDAGFHRCVNPTDVASDGQIGAFEGHQPRTDFLPDDNR